MAGELQIGRVSMGYPSEMTESRSVDSREFVLRGFIRDATRAQTEATRNALLEQQGQVIAISYTGDTHYDGFYLLSDVRID